MATVSISKDFKFDKKNNSGSIKKIIAQNKKAENITLKEDKKLLPEG